MHSVELTSAPAQNIDENQFASDVLEQTGRFLGKVGSVVTEKGRGTATANAPAKSPESLPHKMVTGAFQAKEENSLLGRIENSLGHKWLLLVVFNQRKCQTKVFRCKFGIGHFRRLKSGTNFILSDPKLLPPLGKLAFSVFYRRCYGCCNRV